MPPFLPCAGEKKTLDGKKKQPKNCQGCSLWATSSSLHEARVAQSEVLGVGERRRRSSLVGALLVAGDPVGGSAPSVSVWPSSNLGSLHPIDTARRQEEDRRRPRPPNLENKLFISQSTQKTTKNCLVIGRELAGERADES